MENNKFKIITAAGKVLGTTKISQFHVVRDSGTEDETRCIFPVSASSNLSCSVECRIFTHDLSKLFPPPNKVQIIYEPPLATFPRKMKKAIKTGALNTKFARKAKNYLNRHPIIKLDGELSLLQGANLGVINVDTQKPDAKESVFNLEDYLRHKAARMRLGIV